MEKKNTKKEVDRNEMIRIRLHRKAESSSTYDAEFWREFKRKLMEEA